MSLWRYTSELASNGGQALPTTWQDFKSFLIGAFQPINPVKLARDKLSTLRQTSSVQAYFYHFQTLSMEIPGLSGDESTDRFIRGLKPHIRQEIELRGLTTFPDILTTAQRMDALTYKGLPSAPNNGYSNKRNGNSYIQPSYPQQSYPQSFHDESTPMEIDAIRNNQPNRQQNNRPPPAQQRNRFQQQPPQVNVAQQFAPRPKLLISNVTTSVKTMDVSIVAVLATIVWTVLSKKKTGPNNSTTFRMTGREMFNSGLSLAVTGPCCHSTNYNDFFS